MSPVSGDTVRVVAGSYTGWNGKVSRVEWYPPRVIVAITVFGTSVAIELRPSEVEPCSDGGTAYARYSDPSSDPDSPVRVPRRSAPSGRNSAASIVEPEDGAPADANAGTVRI